MDCLTHCGAAGSHSTPPATESGSSTAIKEWQDVMVLSITESAQDQEQRPAEISL